MDTAKRPFTDKERQIELLNYKWRHKLTLLFVLILFIPPAASAQVSDSLKITTRVIGQIKDAVSGQPLPLISIQFVNSRFGTVSDKDGKFILFAPGSFKSVIFSYVGYKTVKAPINAGQPNDLQISMAPGQTELKEVSVTSRLRYRNKNNPAVELIRQVIAHKNENRIEGQDYLQYEEYERVGLSFLNMPAVLVKSRLFKPYRFMIDSITLSNGEVQTLIPVYLSEKLFDNYNRKTPPKSIRLLKAQKQINLVKFIDTTGVDIYLNKLYGDKLDIYDNNLMILTRQLLSPIADHAPDFYKFFIVDTLQTAQGKFVELSFTPRNKADLLFEGNLKITTDGRYAVVACTLHLDMQVNLNFVRSMEIDMGFSQFSNGRYFLSKNHTRIDFGVLSAKGTGVLGERTTFYSGYLFSQPREPDFYRGSDSRFAPGYERPDTNIWAGKVADTLSSQEASTFSHMNRLQTMKAYKVASWLANTFVGNYADLGPVQLGQISDAFGYDNLEGARFQLGGRTTPELSRSVYFDAYLGYGSYDKQFKYNINAYLSLNKTAFYRYPNNYFRLSYQYDISIPGQDFLLNSSQPPLSSFQSGSGDYFMYSGIFKLNYVREVENHFSYDLGFKRWDRQAAGTLVYRMNNAVRTLVDHLTTSEFDIALRYAPHEQIIQGTTDRTTIHSKYPVLNLQFRQGVKGAMNGSYSFTGINANVAKRFYLSQLGYMDVTLLGGALFGKVPFPLLNISPANESVGYDPDAYNKMYYLEFVSDHYAGINITQAFGGFFLNKVPLIKHLKWREFLSFKALYGGLRKENNPDYSTGLFEFPIGRNGGKTTYALSSKPYLEAGVGIGNIFKLLRVNLIRRLNYLDHPGVSPYSVKFDINLDF